MAKKTKDQKAYEEFKNNRKENLTLDQVKFLCELYHSKFRVKGNVWIPDNPTNSATKRVIEGMIERLDKTI